MRKSLIILLFAILSLPSKAQDCSFSIQGRVLDKASGQTLLFSNVYLEESGIGSVVDSLGEFIILDVCPGSYHLRVSHIGCETQRHFIELRNDTFLTIELNHHHELLDEVHVHGSKEEISTRDSKTLSADIIAQESHKNLSDILEDIEGVEVLKTGTGISKPIVHGLYGNRVTVLNNGIGQAGQQWGNDHAPEIDPFVADHISVVKGAGALEFGNNSLGAIILVEPPEIENDPHVHGQLNYIYETNGRAHSINTAIEQSGKSLGWKFIGTFKKAGDKHTPEYLLRNTGKSENNFAILLEPKLNEKWHSKIYYSLFDADIGVLRGSHVANTDDLMEAIGRIEPFFTNDTFTYNIDPPKQGVTHHLFKTEAKFLWSDNKVLNFVYGGQINNRKEFDVRRSGRSDIPALSLKQLSSDISAKFSYQLKDEALIKTGIDFSIVDNTNNPETGILPLIPDFRSLGAGVFFVFQKNNEILGFEGGARFDYSNILVLNITNNIPREVERLTHKFKNFALSGGINYKASPQYLAKFNIGYTQRAPHINELYSSGLHQGVASIEEGNPNLNSEKSIKLIFSQEISAGKIGHVDVLAYYHSIADYIYLLPEEELRLTIRGAFPVFSYNKTDASLYGIDFSATLEPNRNISLNLKYAWIKGNDRTNERPLIYIPSNNFSAKLELHLEGNGVVKESQLEMVAKYVFKQNDFVLDQDFLEPPDGYLLLEANIRTKLRLLSKDLEFSLFVENLLDKKYRNYLNRNRYYAYEIGRNIGLRMNLKF